MLQMEHSLTDVLQFSPVENCLDILEQSIVSPLGTSQTQEAIHIRDTASQDKRSSSDPLLDFSDMESAEYQFLEPFLADVDQPPEYSSSFSMITATTVEESASFNDFAVHNEYQVQNLNDTECESSKCIEIDLYSENGPSKIQSCVDSEIELNTELKEHNSAAEGKTKSIGNTAENKYLEMRRKNNIASRHSRKIRKVKDKETLEKLKELAAQNQDLLRIAEKLEKERDWLKSYLMKVISRKK